MQIFFSFLSFCYQKPLKFHKIHPNLSTFTKNLLQIPPLSSSAVFNFRFPQPISASNSYRAASWFPACCFLISIVLLSDFYCAAFWFPLCCFLIPIVPLPDFYCAASWFLSRRFQLPLRCCSGFWTSCFLLIFVVFLSKKQLYIIIYSYTSFHCTIIAPLLDYYCTIIAS